MPADPFCGSEIYPPDFWNLSTVFPAPMYIYIYNRPLHFQGDGDRVPVAIFRRLPFQTWIKLDDDYEWGEGEEGMLVKRAV